MCNPGTPKRPHVKTLEVIKIQDQVSEMAWRWWKSRQSWTVLTDPLQQHGLLKIRKADRITHQEHQEAITPNLWAMFHGTHLQQYKKKKIQKKVAKWCRKVDLSVNFMIHGREWKWGIRNSAMCPTRNFVMVVFLGFFCNSCLETLEYLCKLGLLVRVKYSFLASAEFYRNACSYEKIIARPKRNQTCAYS